MATQRDVFDAKYHNLKDEQEILAQRRHQTEEEITGLEKLIPTEDKQIAAIEGETKDLEMLIKKGLTTRERNLLLRRQQREFEGRAGNQHRVDRPCPERDGRDRHADPEPQHRAAERGGRGAEQDRGGACPTSASRNAAPRTCWPGPNITAPVDGIVMDLKVHTTGGVVKPGETLVTVVPLGEKLVVEAMVKPEDIETIAPGQTARVSFPAFARYNLPPLDGVVDTVSADRLVEERSGAPYFAATVLINKSELAKLEGRKLLPGMTSEAMIRTGSRTMLAYLAEPITQNLRRSLREK